MKFHFASFLIICFMKIVNLHDVNDQNVEPGVASFTEINKTDAVIGISVTNESLSSQNLSDLHDIAKNISHSKGMYRETNKEATSDGKHELRRSILRKYAVSTESDVIKELLRSFNSDDEDSLHLLEQVEYFVHQYDVAINFATLGGIDIISPLLLSSDDKISSAAASVLGAAMQSNPTVQKLAVKQNVGRNLLELLSHESPVVLSKIIFALGTFLRNAPEAQEEFLRLCGVSKLTNILKKHQISTNTKLKIINIFNDLSVEQQTAKHDPSERSLENVQKFERLFTTEIQNSNICQLIPTFLDLEDFDTHQKIVAAMTSLCSICLKDFHNEKINIRIKKLIKLYDPDADGEGPVYPHIDKDLRRTIYDELKSLLKQINVNISNKSLDESKYIKTEL